MLEELRDYRTTQQEKVPFPTWSPFKKTHTQLEDRTQTPSRLLFVRMLSKMKSVYEIKLLCSFSGWVQPNLPCLVKLALGDLKVAKAVLQDDTQTISAITAHMI